ncbi:MAG: hypothetical protein MK135_06140 [Polyangiaceae bacterium]|nr:hypothetical protein [Polyangiaceae bacterium]
MTNINNRKAMTQSNQSFSRLKALLAGLLAAGTLLVAAPQEASAEEIRITGPLAGQPAVRKLRLYREGRLELTPSLSFTLLDKYRRNILVGVRANYGIFDWLSAGVWAGFSSSMVGLEMNTNLTNEIQSVNGRRDCANAPWDLECKLTDVNLGDDFKEQVANLNWIVSPQLTAVPFRGKLGLFGNIFVDADLYVFAGPAIVGVDERAFCDGTCTEASSFAAQSRTLVSATFGLGFTFFTGKWTSVGAEWRGLPFKWNAGGFDVAGGGPNAEFPDGNINEDDRELAFNQMLTLSFNMYLPTDYATSE